MKHCPRCGASHNKPGTFCSRNCANVRHRTDESKQRTSASLKGRITGKAYVGVKICEMCETEFTVTSSTKGYKYCSSVCANKGRSAHGRINGKLAAAKIQRRSKNEIMFASLCEQHFDQTVVNVPMFNGWDADVILLHERVAVLWNGPWHYRKITKAHSLEQVQNRDRIKLDEIRRAEFVPYTIRDNGSYNKAFVLSEFEKFKSWVGELAITHLSYG